MENKYLETLLAQIREKRARECVRQEVTSHLEDQKASYMAEGLSEEAAAQKAVADMGDPVEAGAALDLIHKPKPAWGMLAMIALLCAAGVFLQYTVFISGNASQMSDYFFKNQCLYAAAGFLVLCVIYLTDYTKIAKYSRLLCSGILLFLYFAMINGVFLGHSGPYWLHSIQVMGIHTAPSMFLYLYIPLYGAVLYSYRNCRKQDLWKILAYTVLPIYVSRQLSYLSVTMNLSVILFILLAAAIAKGWFQVLSGKFRIFMACTAAGGFLLFLVLCVFPLKNYQSERIKAWLVPGYARNGSGYINASIRSILSTSQLVGKNTALPADSCLPDYSSDYILTFLIGEFGVLAAAALVILVIMLGVKLLHISIHQKNQLGMVMGLGCSLVFAFQAAQYILINLSLLPAASVYFPLVSFGGSGMIQTCILLGILLSTYRYENVISEPAVNNSRNAFL